MAVCEGCGKMMIFSNEILGHKLCSKCTNRLEIFEWDENFATNADVVKKREEVLFKASKYGISEKVVQSIVAHLNSKIEEGLIYQINGYEGQIIKVYEDYCKIITTDECDEDEIAKKYARSMRKGVSFESIFSDGTVAKTFAMGLVSKKSLVKTGMNLASSVMLNTAIDKYFPGKANVVVTPGTKTIRYVDCENIELMKHDTDREECIGVIRFVLNKGIENNFFYSDQNDSAKKICGIINDLVSKAKIAKQDNENKKSNLVNNSTVADEILKFKKLLDMGAITREEFESKKKQLLDL